ncbi:MAG: hypothetical protein GX847_10205, partial [Clostridiales bacterium]|nr:hypothetical protein [Clostridiales bacterium]
MVKAAVSKGCTAFGISGHSPMGFPTRWTMTREGEQAFIHQMDRLKKAYKDQITLFTGLERDYYSPEPAYTYDYVIGSVHYIKKDSALLSVDDTEKAQVEAGRDYYGGDFYAYTRAYYET